MGAERCQPAAFLRLVQLPALTGSTLSPSAAAGLQRGAGERSAALCLKQKRGWEVSSSPSSPPVVFLVLQLLWLPRADALAAWEPPHGPSWGIWVWMELCKAHLNGISCFFKDF